MKKHEKHKILGKKGAREARAARAGDILNILGAVPHL
jgi:hypothetical protein